eukprot:2214158-Pleurochrysis_carterae.AAC.1
MEVGTAAAIACSSVAWDSRNHAIHTRPQPARPTSCGKRARLGLFGSLKASMSTLTNTSMVLLASSAETSDSMFCRRLVRINSRKCVCVDSSGSPTCVKSAGQRSTPQFSSRVAYPHVVVQRVIGRMHLLRENDIVRVVQGHLSIQVVHWLHCSNGLWTHGVESKLTGHRVASHWHWYRRFSARRSRDAHTQVTQQKG